MSYLLMCVAILFCAANSCLLRAYGSKKKDAPAGVFGFNCLVSVGWGIILTVLFSAGDRAISPLAALSELSMVCCSPPSCSSRISRWARETWL